MKIVAVYGQNHKGSTYSISRMLIDKLGGEVEEFFLPRDFDEFCIGCNSCFTIDESKCPHNNKIKIITQAIDKADIIILASPVYVMNVTASMKAFLDHCAYRFMVHRPEEKMFSKQAVCISTAAGAGTRATNKLMSTSAFFWGCARVYKLGINVKEASWERVNKSIKTKVDKKTSAIADKLIKNVGRVKPGIKTRLLFRIMQKAHKKGMNEVDSIYWEQKGWFSKLPWT